MVEKEIREVEETKYITGTGYNFNGTETTSEAAASGITFSLVKDLVHIIGEISIEELFQILVGGDNENFTNKIRECVVAGDKEAANNFKKQLLGTTPSGIFLTRRLTENLVSYNQIVLIDIDNIPDGNYTEIFNKAKSLENTLLAFKSPGGQGINIFVRVSSGVEDHKTAFEQVKQYYDAMLEIASDKQANDVARLKYLSHDPEAYLNVKAEVFKVILKKEQMADYAVSGNINEQWKKAVSWIEAEMDFVEGQRNNFVFQLACNCKKLGILEYEAEALILNNYGYDRSEIRSSVRSCYKHSEDFGKYAPKINGNKSNATYKQINFNKDVSISLPLGELINRVKNEPPVKMVYPGIKENSFGLVYGLAKTGKTIWCENMGMAIAAGRSEFLGKPIDLDNRKVLFMSLEENYIGRTERNMKQLLDFNEDEQTAIMTNYVVVNEHVPRLIQSDEDWDILTKQIEEHQPGIVFLDSLTRLSSDIETLVSAKPSMMKLRSIAEDYQVTLVVIHHSIKVDPCSPMTIQSIAGSRVVSQEADFVIGINRSFSGQRYIKLVFARYANDDCEKVELFKMDDNCSILITGEEYEGSLLNVKTDNRKNDDNAEKLYSYFVSNEDKETVPTLDLKKEFVEQKIMSEPTLHDSLDKLINAGRIQKVSHGNYRAVK